MYSSSIVLFHSDSSLAHFLMASLRNSFRSIRVVQSMDDLRATVASSHAGVVILDMEVASLSEVEHLTNDFPGLHIVCIHRLADEEMWTAALNAGAEDVCSSTSPGSILAAVRRHVIEHPTAA
ncbi:MAG TPA: hypothetical protein VLW84_09280 [Terriglobales bacterium]|nr:hypothetical protein [Terriglobales bacterium]